MMVRVRAMVAACFSVKANLNSKGLGKGGGGWC